MYNETIWLPAKNSDFAKEWHNLDKNQPMPSFLNEINELKKKVVKPRSIKDGALPFDADADSAVFKISGQDVKLWLSVECCPDSYSIKHATITLPVALINNFNEISIKFLISIEQHEPCFNTAFISDDKSCIIAHFIWPCDWKETKFFQSDYAMALEYPIYCYGKKTEMGIQTDIRLQQDYKNNSQHFYSIKNRLYQNLEMHILVQYYLDNISYEYCAAKATLQFKDSLIQENEQEIGVDFYHFMYRLIDDRRKFCPHCNYRPQEIFERNCGSRHNRIPNKKYESSHSTVLPLNSEEYLITVYYKCGNCGNIVPRRHIERIEENVFIGKIPMIPETDYWDLIDSNK